MFSHVNRRPTENPNLKKMVGMVCRATTDENQKVILISLDFVTAPFENIMKQIFFKIITLLSFRLTILCSVSNKTKTYFDG